LYFILGLFFFEVRKIFWVHFYYLAFSIKIGDFSYIFLSVRAAAVAGRAKEVSSTAMRQSM